MSGCRVTAKGGRALVDAWMTPDATPEIAWVQTALSGWGVDARVTLTREDPSWYTATRDFHRPIEVGGVLRIRPPWEPRVGGLVDVVIDPGMAFGSGQHATSRGCLEALCAIAPGGVLDVGCGSGILAIAAAKLGFAPVRAVDIDPDSVAATRENAVANGVEIEVELTGAGVAQIRGEDVLLANLTATVLLEVADAPPRPLPRHAVLSGMRGFELDPVHGAWERLGLSLERVIEADGWCTSVLVR